MQPIPEDNLPLISVIVPAYHVEPYIEQCVRSLMKQTYLNYEVILVCQLSEDGTEVIVRRLQEEFQRLQVYETSERGVSKARNYALERMKGDYVVFVDADDWVEEEYLFDLYETIQGYELGACGYARVREQKNPEDSVASTDSGQEVIIQRRLVDEPAEYTVYPKLETIEKILCDNSFGSYLWNKIFFADIIKRQKLRFDTRLSIGEDMLFLAGYIGFVGHARYHKKALYNYRYNPNSALRTMYSSGKAETRKLESSVKAALLVRKQLMAACHSDGKEEKAARIPDNGILEYSDWKEDEASRVLDMANYRIMRSALWAYFNSLKCDYYDKQLLEHLRNWSRGTWNSYRKSRYSKKLEKTASLLIVLAPKLSWRLIHRLLKLLPEKFTKKYVDG